MKKIEAQAIAQERSRLIIEYITKILSDIEKVDASMNFTSTKIDNQKMCTLDIYAPQWNFEEHLNLGITSEHSLVLYEQLLNDFLDIFLEHETMGVTKYRSIKSSQGSFSGINAVNTFGSKIKINFNTTSPDFMIIVSEYTRRYNEFAESINNQEQSNLR